MTPQNLTSWRRSLGLSQRVFGRMVGVTARSVSRWETGAIPVPSLLPIVRRLLDMFVPYERDEVIKTLLKGKTK